MVVVLSLAKVQTIILFSFFAVFYFPFLRYFAFLFCGK